MGNCKFETVEGPCTQTTVTFRFCQEHERFREETHNFYKRAESQLKKVSRDQSSGEIFEQCHRLLLLAIAGRLVHTEMFFKDDYSESHAIFVGSLFAELNKEEERMFQLGTGFTIQGASYDKMHPAAYDSVKQAFVDWNDSDKSQSIETFIRDFPRAIASGNEVPEAVRVRHAKRMNPRDNNVGW
ncbi:hypothetical protein F5Y03DRAFT_400505 [Xylaria venustula]|nr:hypothetical protein F5Y03DRAFT_400505 [Xylaria venustula]